MRGPLSMYRQVGDACTTIKFLFCVAFALLVRAMLRYRGFGLVKSSRNWDLIRALPNRED